VLYDADLNHRHERSRLRWRRAGPFPQIVPLDRAGGSGWAQLRNARCKLCAGSELSPQAAFAVDVRYPPGGDDCCTQCLQG